MIPEGYRAMTVKVDDVVGISGFIMPGTLVDVVVTITPDDRSSDPISKIVLQNIKVLASGQNIDKPKNDREVERSIRAVTLQVTPEQAEKLALASSEGKLQLVMRNSVDPYNGNGMAYWTYSVPVAAQRGSDGRDGMGSRIGPGRRLRGVRG